MSTEQSGDEIYYLDMHSDQDSTAALHGWLESVADAVTEGDNE